MGTTTSAKRADRTMSVARKAQTIHPNTHIEECEGEYVSFAHKTLLTVV